MEVAALDKIADRLARMEDLLYQLIGLVAKTNSAMAEMEARTTGAMSDMEARLMNRIDGLGQRIDQMAETIHRDVTVLKSESDHLARKIGVLERDVAVLRGQT